MAHFRSRPYRFLAEGYKGALALDRTSCWKRSDARKLRQGPRRCRGSYHPVPRYSEERGMSLGFLNTQSANSHTLSQLKASVKGAPDMHWNILELTQRLVHLADLKPTLPLCARIALLVCACFVLHHQLTSCLTAAIRVLSRRSKEYRG
jgi:hypothetical protein